MKKRVFRQPATSDDEDSPQPKKHKPKQQTAKNPRKTEASNASFKTAPKSALQQTNKPRHQSVETSKPKPKSSKPAQKKPRQPPDSQQDFEIDSAQVQRKFAELESKPYEQITADLADYFSKRVADGIRDATRDEEAPARQAAPKPRHPREMQLPSLPSDLPGVNKLTRAEQVAIMNHFAMIQPSRPLPCFFHCVFKLVAALSYLFSGLLLQSLVVRFLLTFMSLVTDFWVTKNLTGRMLVGLRWWSGDVGDSQGQAVYFESFDADLNFNAFDKSIFWGGLLSATGFWLFFALGRLLTADLLWGLLSCTGLLLNWTNLKSYYQCHRFHRRKVAGQAQTGRSGLFEKLALVVF